MHLNTSKPQQCWTFYHSEGDINVGTVLRESLVENLDTACWVYPLLMPFLAAIEDVNHDESVLPNTTLGFTVQVWIINRKRPQFIFQIFLFPFWAWLILILF